MRLKVVLLCDYCNETKKPIFFLQLLIMGSAQVCEFIANVMVFCYIYVCICASVLVCVYGCM